MLTAAQLRIPTLGEPTVESPLAEALRARDAARGDRPGFDGMRYDDAVPPRHALPPGEPIPAFEVAGAEHRLFHDPAATTAGIVTCGGLCPGLNDVIRGLVMVLHHRYSVKNILGFRYGYEGLNPAFGHEPLRLTPDRVSQIHEDGGTMLGSSRGPQPNDVMVTRLLELGVNVMFCIGGDGTLRGALALSAEARRRNAPISIVGLPKTIDNDISYVEQSFGLVTAATRAAEAIDAAHNEALGARRGVGLVKLMGRHSGFIAASAAMANNDVNYVLIPEVDFPLEGPGGLLDTLAKRLDTRDHALIVLAEGAGQSWVESAGTDKSGNTLLGDAGAFLRDRIIRHFKDAGQPIAMKYIDPSYIIRGCRANAYDSAYCFRLAAYAVHAAMAGKTEMIIGKWHGKFVHIPIALATAERQCVDPHGELWAAVLDATGQPRWA